MSARPRSGFQVGVILVVFFFISLLTNITGPLIPDVIRTFSLSLTMAAFLPFSFFVAYAVMSIPAGILVERHGEKPVLLGAFALAFAGAALFCALPVYRTALVSLFMIGLGMAALQVALSPLLRVAGGEEHFAFNSVLGQLVFGIASFASPLVYSHMVVTMRLPWIDVYWLFAGIALGMLGLIAFVRFPRVERKADERVGAMDVHVALFAQPVVWLYFIGIFCYVGLEQGLANWMSQFLATYHGLDPQTVGARAVSGFWGAMTVGCALGLVLLKLVDSRKVLVGFGILGLAAVSCALFAPAAIAVYAFPACGFALSVMWSVVFSLALNSLPDHHGTLSGILCTAIVGGAVTPLVIGTLGDLIGLRGGMCLTYLPLLYIVAIGFWARPLIVNKTMGAA